MKTMLVFPRFRYQNFFAEPLSIFYLASVLREEGFDFQVVDGTAETLESTKEKIRAYKPDVLGLSLHTVFADYAKQLSDAFREINPKGLVVTGGPHPSIMPLETLKSFADIVVMGEGEATFPHLLKNLKSLEKVSGVAFLKNGKVVFTKPREPIKNLDDIPFPARDLMADRYFELGNAMLIASRGCPFNCSFCLDGGTQILMEDLTWKPLEDVKVGEKIIGVKKKRYGHSVTTTDVRHEFKRRAKTYRIITDRGQVIATAEHPWLSYSNHSRWRPTKNLKPGDVIHWFCKPLAAKETPAYKKGYMAGAVVGDGSIGHYRRQGRSGLTDHFRLVGDYEMQDVFIKYASDLGISVHPCKFNGGKIYRNVDRAVGGFSKKTVDAMEKLAATDSDDPEFRRGFLAGFFDADGTNGRGSQTIRFSNLDGPVLDRTENYLSDAGYHSVREAKGIRLTGCASVKNTFVSWIQPKVMRKRQLKFGKHPARILKIEELPEQDVFNISTGTENFIANGFVSHNCQPTQRRLFGQGFRQRSPKNVVGEIKYTKELFKDKGYEMKSFSLTDDGITYNKRWLEDFCQLLIKEKIDLPWEGDARADTIPDDALLRLMKKSGCIRISIGIESGNDYIRNAILGKALSREKIVDAFRRCHKSGIEPHSFIMVGSPGENMSTIYDTVKLLDDVKPTTTQVTVTTPLPGTDLYNYCKEEGMINADAWADYDYYVESHIKLEHLTKKQVKMLRAAVKFSIMGRTFLRRYLRMEIRYSELFRILMLPFVTPMLMELEWGRLSPLRRKLQAALGIKFNAV